MTRLAKQLKPSLLLMLATGLLQNVSANPLVPLSECRDQTLDQSGFSECLSLLWQQSDNALIEIEQSWKQVLADDAQEPVTEQVVAPEPVSIADADNTDAGAETDSKVIAIVSGDALGNLPVPANARVINLDEKDPSIENGSATLQDTAPPAVLFESVPVLFREYRDQRCDWEAGISARDSTVAYRLACKIALNRQQVLQLRRLLAEKKASDSAGESYRGYYLRTLSGGNFQSCDRRQDWWVTGSDEVLQALERRYDDISSENLEIVYVELRGRRQPPETSGPGSDFVATLNVGSFNLMRPILELDCQPSSVSSARLIELVADDADDLSEDDLADGEDSRADDPGPPAVTVDDLGDAGFLYGYFSNWNSACAVDKLSVCRAQTQVEYSSEGEWQIVVDRSSQNSWRVRLIPTIESHRIEGKMVWSIDNSDKTEVSAPDNLIEINRGLVLASGQRAKSVVKRLRAGGAVEIEWLKPDQSSAILTFSLVGITRALQYFDQAEK